MPKQFDYLYEHLNTARIDAPGPAHVEIQNFCLNRDSKTTLFQHPSSRVEFSDLELGQDPALSFFCGIKQSAWKRMKNGVSFEVRLCADGDEQVLFQKTLDPARRSEDRRWHEERVSLNAWAGRRVHLIFITGISGRSSAYAWSGWGEPTVEYEKPALAVRKRKPACRTGRDPHPHVFLITADALRPDFLGCYGHPTVRTPHLDRLAGEGVLFKHTRTHSPTTLGSYTSLLTGKFPLEHGLNAEWGSFPSHLPNIPVFLAEKGYHTVLAGSELELQSGEQGFSSLFKEYLPCLVNPAQDGTITTRRVIKHLEARPDNPHFFWIQYFDTHPPDVPPEPYRSMYYKGEPSTPSDPSDFEGIREVRGTEAVGSIRLGLRLLKNGIADTELTHRLLDAGRMLQGKIHSGPDMAYHLLGLGKRAMRGMTPLAFGGWLEEQAKRMLEGHVDQELVKWLKNTLPMFAEVDEDIIVWLDGVKDYRYLLSQYMGSISYLDAQIGALVQFLKDEGIYDQSLILFTSPHGELFGQHGIHFHHHVLFESILRVPLILKPPASASFKKNERIDGIFDSVDIFPTLLEILGLSGVSGLSGKSRWGNVARGDAIEPHPSHAIANHGIAASLVDGPYKFLKVYGSHEFSDSYGWRPGDRHLFNLKEDPDEAHNQIASLSTIAVEMESSLASLMRLK